MPYETTADYAGEELATVGDMLKDRNRTHGDALDQHAIMATLWRMYLFENQPDGVRVRNIGAADAMFLMLLMKVSRVMASGLQKQHIEDIVGYAALILGTIARYADAPALDDEEGPQPEEVKP